MGLATAPNAIGATVAMAAGSAAAVPGELARMPLRTVSSRSPLFKVSSEMPVLSNTVSSSQSWFKSSCTADSRVIEN